MLMASHKLLGHEHIKIKIGPDSELLVRMQDRLGRALLLYGSFEKTITDCILSQLEEGMTVIDIGANIGYYTILMARAVGENGRVIAVEPNPVMVRELTRNIAINNIKNVDIESIALSHENGQIEFYCPEYGAESHGSLRPNRTFQINNTIAVQTERIDDLLARIGCKKVDFVKIDAEGAEYSIFNGGDKLLTQMKPRIIFECAETLREAFGGNVFDCLAYIHSKGYQLREIDYGMWLGRPLN